jgi:ABC-type molybdate transport system substrate-binding protein
MQRKLVLAILSIIILLSVIFLIILLPNASNTPAATSSRIVITFDDAGYKRLGNRQPQHVPSPRLNTLAW